jgi:4-hydroxy-tetrahydrodipicolinate reductase
MLWIHGCKGKMGQILWQEALAQGVEVAGGSDRDYCHAFGADGRDMQQEINRPEVTTIIDFSTALGIDALLKTLTTPKALLVCTTGHKEFAISRMQNWAVTCSGKVLVAPNTSIAILALTKILPQLYAALGPGYSWHIHETHHAKKLDAPSGTANALAKALQPGGDWKNKMTSVRAGTVIGEHDVRFIGEHDEVFLGHHATSRQLFAQGALTLGRWLVNQTPKKVFSLDDVSIESFKQFSATRL